MSGPISSTDLHEGASERPLAPRPLRLRIGTPRTLAILLALLSLAGLFLLGYLPKRAAQERLVVEARELASAVPEVKVVRPKRRERAPAIKLPATLAADEQTTVYARAGGYVRRRLVDLGDRVEAQQALAEIDTPELDRELEQARATVAERAAARVLAEASRDLARSTLLRHQLLAARKLTSRSDLEHFEAEARVNDAKVQVAEAEQRAQEASLNRLAQLKAFATVRAPFAGTITARTVERGALVVAGTGSPLFELARLDPLRITVDVPQRWVTGVASGRPAKLTVGEYPGRQFEAKVARTAGRVDPKTRTLRAELDVENAKGALMPGMYGSVELTLGETPKPFVIPASAVLNGKGGTQVAAVDVAGNVRFRKIVIERDDGAEMEIASGLDGTEVLVANPAPSLIEGAVVRPKI